MPDLGVTIRTLDLVVSNVIPVHKLGGVPSRQDSRFVMALQTFPLGDMGVSLNDIDMTPLAGHPPGDVFAVIKIPPFHIDIPFGLHMTGRATPYRT